MKQNVNWDIYSERLVKLQKGTSTDYNLLSSFARGNILDAGCGVGTHLGNLTNLDLDIAIGIDMGLPGLFYGQKNFPHAKFIAASLYHLPFRNNYYDFVYSIDVIEHLEKPVLALQEYYRVCKPGGQIFIQTPNYPIKRVYDLYHWLSGSRQMLADDPTHVYRFNAFGLRAMMTEVGWRIISMSARNIAFQRLLPNGETLCSNWFGYCLGQKVIVVACKP